MHLPEREAAPRAIEYCAAIKAHLAQQHFNLDSKSSYTLSVRRFVLESLAGYHRRASQILFLTVYHAIFMFSPEFIHALSQFFQALLQREYYIARHRVRVS